jgi:hypothetical protein
VNRTATALFVLASCSLDRSGQSATDGARRDAGAPSDAGAFDAAPADAGSVDGGAPDAPGFDAGGLDAGAPDAGFDAGPPCVPAGEVCNARDDDCDDVIDEAGCECDVRRNLGSVYLFCPDRFGGSRNNWYDGRDFCAERGYHLAKVETEAEDEWMMDTGFALGGDYFIGLSDEDDEGMWLWTDRTAATWFHWIGAEPNGERTENCVEVRTVRGWNDRPCNYDRRFVCETP